MPQSIGYFVRSEAQCIGGGLIASRIEKYLNASRASDVAGVEKRGVAVTIPSLQLRQPSLQHHLNCRRVIRARRTHQRSDIMFADRCHILARIQEKLHAVDASNYAGYQKRGELIR